MEELSSIENKSAESDEKVMNGNDSTILSKYIKSLPNIFQKLVQFICYGPGVLGFLWLIGRILKR